MKKKNDGDFYVVDYGDITAIHIFSCLALSIAYAYICVSLYMVGKSWKRWWRERERERERERDYVSEYFLSSC